MRVGVIKGGIGILSFLLFVSGYIHYSLEGKDILVSFSKTIFRFFGL